MLSVRAPNSILAPFPFRPPYPRSQCRCLFVLHLLDLVERNFRRLPKDLRIESFRTWHTNSWGKNSSSSKKKRTKKMKSSPNGAPRPDIPSPWRQLLSLPLPCHKHCGGRSCGIRPRLEPGQRHGCGGSVSGTAGRRRPLGVLLAAGRACGSCVRVGVWEACRPGVFQLCGVRYAWTLELVRRLVGLSGLLLRWPFRVFSCCCMGEGWAVEMVEMFLTMRTIRVARS